MKVLTVLGTRPEIIRLSRVVEKLDHLSEHVIVHTGQNYDRMLNDVFFEELGVRRPDHFLEAGGGPFGEQIGLILARGEQVLRDVEPDRFLVLGDTNSSMLAIVAKRLGIPVFHMEAGNRCYDDRVPEEVNRRVIDHSSDILMPYTARSRENLLAEGIPGRRIYVTGNPIYEVIQHHRDRINRSDVFDRLGVEKGKFFLVTMHRQENVDVEPRLRALVESLRRAAAEYAMPVIVSVHPRTRKRLAEFGLDPDDPWIKMLEPLGFFDFVALEANAFCVISDSGTVQEECCILRTANVTIRDTTERPETLDCGSNILSGVESDSVLRCVRTVLECASEWQAPPEYLVKNVSDTIIRIVMGFFSGNI
jgi:UDP-N-acetylglucosamine 2-epimerase (non-hydrolysing)